jgi:Tol biopolymer transport system component
MNRYDHAVTVLTKEYDNFPVWSRRGDLIAFIRKTSGDFEVFTIHPDGKDRSQLTNTPCGKVKCKIEKPILKTYESFFSSDRLTNAASVPFCGSGASDVR